MTLCRPPIAKKRKNHYVTSVERIGTQQGILKTLREGVVEILDVHFENIPEAIARIIADIDDFSILKMLHKKAATAISIEAFESILNDSRDRD